MIIGVDVDDVVVDLVSRWLELYNTEYFDNVRLDQIKTWEIFDFVKCGQEIYKYLKHPGLYAGIKPIDGALQAINLLRQSGHRIVFITSCVMGQFDQKWESLQRFGFLDNARHSNDFIAATDKILLNVDLMIDDKPETVMKFEDRGVLFKRPWNNGTATWESIVVDYARRNVRQHLLEIL